jgi:hypothetical protein
MIVRLRESAEEARLICLLAVCAIREDSNGSIKTVLFDLGYFLALGVGIPRVKIVY